MTSIPPITVKEHLCCRKEEVLAELAATQARSAPTLFRNFVITVLPQLLPDDWKNSSHLKKITPHNPLVTLFCQASPGDFPQNLLQETPFHEFLDEWERRVSIEAAMKRQEIASPSEPIADASASSLPLNSKLSLHSDVFLGNSHLQNLSEELQQTVGPSPFETNRLIAVPENPLSHGLEMAEKGRLWMGNANHVSHLHFDAHHGLLITLHGHKRVHLYEPLYHTGIIKKSSGNHAQDNPLTHPLNKEANPLVVDLHAGDALFIPLYWWHLVASVQSSIAINFWCYPDLEASKLKFGCLWPFARLVCVDHIKAHLSANANASAPKRSKWSLLTNSNTMEIVDALLRFKLPPSALEPSNSPTGVQHTQDAGDYPSPGVWTEEEVELAQISNWRQLREFGALKVKSVISEDIF